MVVIGGQTGESVLLETSVLALGLGDVPDDVTDVARELLVDEALKRPQNAAVAACIEDK